MKDIKITAEEIDIVSCVDWVMTPQSGGIDVFIGTVRDATKGKKVTRLEFEAYENMALNEMKKITEEILAKWPVHKILIHHRTGLLNIEEIPVVIAVSAAHRAAEFDACHYAIDTLKQ